MPAPSKFLHRIHSPDLRSRNQVSHFGWTSSMPNRRRGDWGKGERGALGPDENPDTRESPTDPREKRSTKKPKGQRRRRKRRRRKRRMRSSRPRGHPTRRAFSPRRGRGSVGHCDERARFVSHSTNYRGRRTSKECTEIGEKAWLFAKLQPGRARRSNLAPAF